MNLLFESDLFDEETEIWKKHGASVHTGFFDDRKLKSFAPVVARGSIQFDFSVSAALRQKNWPDLRWPFNNPWRLYSYQFLLMLGPDAKLLNPDAKNVDYGLFGSGPITVKSLLDDETVTWPIWIRSDSGSKDFTGGVFTKEEFAVAHEFCKQNNLLNVNLVIAKPKRIYEEHRLIFVGGEYISGSEYHPDGRKAVDGFMPGAVISFGKKWVEDFGHNWRGNLVLDVALTDDGLKVVEVNNVLTSGWYSSDIEAIVSAIVNKVSNL